MESYTAFCEIRSVILGNLLLSYNLILGRALFFLVHHKYKAPHRYEMNCNEQLNDSQMLITTLLINCLA